MGIQEKEISFDDFVKTYDIDPEEVLYMGDDVPDLSVIEKGRRGYLPSGCRLDVKRLWIMYPTKKEEMDVLERS